MSSLLIKMAAASGLVISLILPAAAKEPNVVNTNTQIAVFAAGCFWGVESAFSQLKGVRKTTVGYTGGDFKNPTYKDVRTGKTGHAEAVKIEYDPGEITYVTLLEVFWGVHDPTTLNRQGLDIGHQYRSVIFFSTPEQEKAARRSKEVMESSGKFKGKVVTEIIPAGEFYPAEEYHQRYYEKRGLKPVCHISQGG